MNQRNSFLGTGWAFPVEFRKTAVQCNVSMAEDVEDIKQSLDILFSTRTGERVMHPDYGAALDHLVFEPINESLKNLIKDIIKKALMYYEARIELIDINIDDSEVTEGRILIELTFTVRQTNSRFNYVFDYYKREATIVSL